MPLKDTSPTTQDIVELLSNPGTLLPRRYADTIFSKLQDVTHRNIIGLGGKILESYDAVNEAEMNQALDDLEKAMLTHTEAKEQEIYEQARQDALVQQDKIIKKLKREHERLTKEAVRAVRQEMQLAESERMRDAREESNRRLRDAVREKEEEWEERIALVTSETRTQEQQLAKVELARVERENKERLEKALREKDQEREAAIHEVMEKLKKEKEKAVEEALMDEARKYRMILDDVRQQQDHEKRRIEEMILKHQMRVEEMKEDQNHNKTCQINLQNKLISLNHAFHDYVDATAKNSRSQNSFLVAPLYNIERSVP